MIQLRMSVQFAVIACTNAGDVGEYKGGKSQVASRRWQVAGGKSQVAGRKSQVAGRRYCVKKVKFEQATEMKQQQGRKDDDV
jgi:hypothetical protein